MKKNNTQSARTVCTVCTVCSLQSAWSAFQHDRLFVALVYNWFVPHAQLSSFPPSDVHVLCFFTTFTFIHFVFFVFFCKFSIMLFLIKHSFQTNVLVATVFITRGPSAFSTSIQAQTSGQH